MSSVTTSAAAVKVFVRVRPLTEKERQQGGASTLRPATSETEGYNMLILDPSRDFRPREGHQFERCFFPPPHTPTEADISMGQFNVYDAVARPLLAPSLDGYNGCIFAYGQTGSGKTFTMMGREGDDTTANDGGGIVPRFSEELFETLRHLAANDPSCHSYRVDCQFYEIYNERVFDLVEPKRNDDLKVRQDPVRGPFVEGLSTHACHNTSDISTLLTRGKVERHIASTKMNDRSSRSHAILTLGISIVRKGEHTVQQSFAKVHLVDLAGSERVNLSGAEGQQLREATRINLSLSTLGRVIDSLADASAGRTSTLPPYRESLLTWLLMDSLGGNSRTTMVATVSPFVGHYDETVQTLRYASRARQIVNTVVANEDPNAHHMQELRLQVERLKRQLALRGGGGERQAELEMRCENLQRTVWELRAEIDSMRSTTAWSSFADRPLDASTTPPRRLSEGPQMARGEPPSVVVSRSESPVLGGVDRNEWTTTLVEWHHKYQHQLSRWEREGREMLSKLMRGYHASATDWKAFKKRFEAEQKTRFARIESEEMRARASLRSALTECVARAESAASCSKEHDRRETRDVRSSGDQLIKLRAKHEAEIAVITEQRAKDADLIRRLQNQVRELQASQREVESLQEQNAEIQQQCAAKVQELVRAHEAQRRTLMQRLQNVGESYKETSNDGNRIEMQELRSALERERSAHAATTERLTTSERLCEINNQAKEIVIADLHGQLTKLLADYQQLEHDMIISEHRLEEQDRQIDSWQHFFNYASLALEHFQLLTLSSLEHQSLHQKSWESEKIQLPTQPLSDISEYIQELQEEYILQRENDIRTWYTVTQNLTDIKSRDLTTTLDVLQQTYKNHCRDQILHHQERQHQYSQNLEHHFNHFSDLYIQYRQHTSSLFLDTMKILHAYQNQQQHNTQELEQQTRAHIISETRAEHAAELKRVEAAGTGALEAARAEHAAELKRVEAAGTGALDAARAEHASAVLRLETFAEGLLADVHVSNGVIQHFSSWVFGVLRDIREEMLSSSDDLLLFFTSVFSQYSSDIFAYRGEITTLVSLIDDANDEIMRHDRERVEETQALRSQLTFSESRLRELELSLNDASISAIEAELSAAPSTRWSFLSYLRRSQ